HQRSRFQQAVEQLERARQKRMDVILSPKLESSDSEDSSGDELVLLEQVREEVHRTFGISFASFLRFLSEYLFAQDESGVKAGVSSKPDELAINVVDSPGADSNGWAHEDVLRLTNNLPGSVSKVAFTDTLS